MAAINRDPTTAPHGTRNDVLLTTVAALLALCLGLVTDAGRRPDAAGWTLLTAAHAALVWRRRRPLLVFAVVIACVLPYHVLDNNHTAPVPASFIALYTVTVTQRPVRTLVVSAAGLALSLAGMLSFGGDKQAVELLRIYGWVFAVIFVGIDVRYYRRYIAAVFERAERAERTREEEARRRVAEERLRIARDLHDLLAHSITLIGVQTSVAAHVLAADPERLDRETVAKALDDIAETCRTARGELRTTLEVLREDGPADARAPLPGLDSLPGLVEAARIAGARVEQTVRIRQASPAVGAAAYRIVQEALTNAVRHAGPEPAVRVELHETDGALHLAVTDDGTGPAAGAAGHAPGFGLVGMRERARSVGGTLDAGPHERGGFRVTAVLPLAATPATVPPPTGGIPATVPPPTGGTHAAVPPPGTPPPTVVPPLGEAT
ncbi:sensor histidine kinase [Streptomyces sp. NPDC058867]|uniref:sensor histidine kinase n=1 Tax=unclassified Streptomyces TaxID=2593676 RepID=UPI0036A92129